MKKLSVNLLNMKIPIAILCFFLIILVCIFKFSYQRPEQRDMGVYKLKTLDISAVIVSGPEDAKYSMAITLHRDTNFPEHSRFVALSDELKLKIDMIVDGYHVIDSSGSFETKVIVFSEKSFGLINAHLSELLSHHSLSLDLVLFRRESIIN